jgi:hypothetical protein
MKWEHSTAVLSPDRVYRYMLIRTWGTQHEFALDDAHAAERAGKLVHFVMLNPSTADEREDDPTIRRVCDFAKRWGYEGVVVTNLFALRTPHPSELINHPAPVGDDNAVRTRQAVERTQLTVCAWGAYGRFKDAGDAMRQFLRTMRPTEFVMHLGLTKDGAPRHPLYIKADTPLQIWVELQ